MIAYLSGVLAHKGAGSAIVEASGVGFEVGMSSNSLAALPETGMPVQVFAYLHLSDAGASMYGFATAAEKEMFEQLIGVSSVGPKIALAALSTFSAEALSAAIMASDVPAISQIPGIGKKTASRIVLELQGTLAQTGQASQAGLAGVMRQVAEALLAMGFTSAEADLALKGAPEGATEAEVLQYALKRLGQ